MTIKSPCEITPRLLPGVRVGDATISIKHTSRRDSEGRLAFRYYIDLPDGGEYSGADLRGSCGATPSLQSMLATLLGFLGACAESYPDGENANLFSKEVAEWAQQNSDEIACLRCEIEETPNVIEE